MAIHRKVRQHSQTYLWAYVEWSDEKQDVFTLLGGQQFLKKEEAEDYSKGFAEGSYEWIEPTELKLSDSVWRKKNWKRESMKFITNSQPYSSQNILK
jgi:hypothetical protein